MKAKEAPLHVCLKGGKLVISIGISNLVSGLENSDYFYDNNFGVTDPVGFADDLCRALQEEDETGDNPITRMFDEAGMNAAEQGSENIEELDEEEE